MLKTIQRQELINKRGRVCECCGLNEWLGQPIKLEIHHLDGNRQNDNESNLQILCPNCHSYTDNHSKNIYNHSITDEELVEILRNSTTIHQALLTANLSTAGANYRRARKLVQQYELVDLYKKEKDQNYCIDCGAPIDNTSIRCLKCRGIHDRVVDHPSREQLKQLIRTTPFTTIGKQYGVSDNAIRKWCDSMNLPRKSSEIKKYTDEEWENI